MSHGGSPPEPAPAPDAAPPPTSDAAVPPLLPGDVGPRPIGDAAPRPRMDGAIPTGCVGPTVPERATRSTVFLGGFGGTALPVDEAFDLPVSIDGCFCGEQVQCEVTTTFPATGPTVIDLHTSLCETGYLCYGRCLPWIDGSCRIPALPAGEYRVRLNGDDGFLLSLPVGRSDTDEQVCFTPAPPAAEPLVCPWETTPIVDVVQLCVPLEVFSATSPTVTVTKGCGGCLETPADCVVTQQGDRLIVDARTRSCDCPVCGACADVCVPVETECRLPPLPFGTYTVVAGALETVIEVRLGGLGGELPPAPTRCASPHG